MPTKRARGKKIALVKTASTDAIVGYDELLRDLKVRIEQAQVRAALAVNSELVLLYWNIGRDILMRQQQQGWGAKVVDRLAADLRRAFPDMKGFSRTNLLYMRSLADTYADEQFVQQVVGQIPWGHNVRILDQVKDSQAREFYIRQTIQHGWSRPVLEMQIESKLYQRQGGATTNFERTLPAPQSDLARQLLKDPYNFDFLTLRQEAYERDLERGLIEHIREFLLELGVGFAFVGSQYHVEVGGQDFYLDLLFYHLRLRAYVVIELKVTEFKPEYAGKMNFYLSAVDDLLRHEQDQPSIGIILCKTKNKVVAEYALRDTQKPIGVSSFQLTESLPAKLQGSLPTIEELEAELSDMRSAEVDDKTVDESKEGL
jgi:predicted nuclease of restriction endonuclease-like (RecB) superfamily